MKVQIRKTDGNFYIFDNVSELSRNGDVVRVRVAEMVRYFEYDTLLEVRADGKDVRL